MAAKKLFIRSFAWAVTFTALFVLTLGAVAISLIVGDWIFLHTGDLVLGWIAGCVVALGFLVNLGTGIGLFLWMRGPSTNPPAVEKAHTMDMLLKDISVIERD